MHDFVIFRMCIINSAQKVNPRGIKLSWVGAVGLGSLSWWD